MDRAMYGEAAGIAMAHRTPTLPARIKTVPRRVLSPDAAGHTHQPKETP